MKKILVILAVVVCGINTMVAQEKKESPWKEVQVVEIPSGQPIHSRVTSKGNTYYYFDFSGLQVGVTTNNKIKYESNQVTLLLVKWQHQETLKFRYSTRQKRAEKKDTPNVDLTNLFN